MTKTKIILDADVIIHFAKGGILSLLPQIFQDYDFVVLDTVYNEIKGPLKLQLDNQVGILGNIRLLKFTPKGEAMKEFALLTSTLGRGESACMVYCKYNNDVIGSSNLSDIKDYCKANNITYLTTIDFLYYAIRKKLITVEEAILFVEEVKRKDSKLPEVDFNTFVSAVQI